MLSNWWLTTLAILEVATLVVLIVTLFRLRFAAQWPSLVVSCLFELATDGVLASFLLVSASYRAYFFVYWAAALTQSMIRLWIVVDVSRSFPGLGFLSPWVKRGIVAFGSSLALTSATYCVRSTAHGIAGLAPFAIMIDRAVCLAWVAFAAGALVCAKLLGFGWDRVGARIAAGIVARFCGTAVTAALLAQKSHNIKLVANGLDSLCTLAVFSFWVYTLHSSRQSRDLKDGVYPRPGVTRRIDCGTILAQRKMS